MLLHPQLPSSVGCLAECESTSSVAGLLAARICSDHFTDVLVLDPDNDALVESALASVPARPSELVEADINMGRHERTRVMQNRMIHATQGA